MSSNEKNKNEGNLEKFARLSILKHMGGFALAAAGAVLLPPVAAGVAGVFAAAEGAGAILSIAGHQHLKAKRQRKSSK